MSDNQILLSLASQCSKESKESLLSFFSQLLKPQQKKQQSQQLQQLQAIFSSLTTNFSVNKAREVSKNERSIRQLSKNQYNYGQIAFNTIFTIVQRIKKLRALSAEEVFYDLGSGSGKVLFAAGLCHPFRKCVGIEYLRSLYQTSCSLKDRITQKQKQIQTRVNEILSLKDEYKLPCLELINEDFKNLSWEQGNIIFVSSTCYSSNLMSEIEKRSEALDKGTIMITLTRKLQQKQNLWRVVDKLQGQTSWGSCNIFIQRKQL